MNRHDLRTMGQQFRCMKCYRIWDFDEEPDSGEECDGIAGRLSLVVTDEPAKKKRKRK